MMQQDQDIDVFAFRSQQAGRFRKRPVTVDAVHIDDIIRKPIEDLPEWVRAAMDKGTLYPSLTAEHAYYIQTHEGVMLASLCDGDWIIRGVQGELYPCKPDVFAATYERVRDGQPEAAADLPSDDRILHVCANEVEKLLNATLARDDAQRIARLIREVADRIGAQPAPASGEPQRTEPCPAPADAKPIAESGEYAVTLAHGEAADGHS